MSIPVTVQSVPITVTVQDQAPITVTISAVGTPGPGVPAGGTTGQVLAKIDATNYNTQWVTGGGGYPIWGGITGTLSNQTDLQTALNTNATAIATETTRATTAEALLVPQTRNVNTTSPITGGGALSSDLTLGINQSLITIAESQVTNLVADLASKASNTLALAYAIALGPV